MGNSSSDEMEEGGGVSRNVAGEIDGAEEAFRRRFRDGLGGWVWRFSEVRRRMERV